MPKSIPPGLTREHVLQALADLATGAEHPFGPPTGYELIHDGKRYAPKAVIGMAWRAHTGKPLLPEEFSGGEAPGQANFVLRKLGFTVMKKEEKGEAQEEPGDRDWSEEEVRLIVDDYFAMLEKELFGKSYSKTEHRKALRPKLDGRSEGSVEFKHANVSAVLTGLGLPYIEGYKPRGNYQALLAREVEAFLEQHPDLLDRLADAPSVCQDEVPPSAETDPEAVIEEPPEQILAVEPAGKPWLSRKGRRIDFVQRDAANRLLGRLGEEFVLALEKHRLLALGRDDLPLRVQWVAQTLGDGLGFDILSFDDADDSEKLIEVKTTGLGKCFPFYVTATEVRCSEDVPELFHLFRVFDFGHRPRVYILPGSLRSNCQLDPTVFRAAL